MSEPTDPEKAREHRQRVLKGGSILRVPLDARIPQEFLLYVPVDGVGYRAFVRWRKLDRVGVAFSGTEPKPSWFYG